MSTDRFSLSKWSLVALAVVIAVIVITPYWLLRRIDAANREAQQLVEHSREVNQAAYDLSYAVRSVESASLALASGIDTPSVRKRLTEDAAMIPGYLRQLRELTADNPRQQLHIGRLDTLIDERLALTRATLANGNNRIAQAEEIVSRFPVRQALAEVREEEDRLLAQRRDESARLSVLRNRVALVSAVLQVLLLALLVYFAQRQLRQRLQAEARARHDAAHAQSVMQAIREPILVLDGEQRVLLHNPAFATLFDLADEARGQPLAEVATGAWRDPQLQLRLADAFDHRREVWDHEQLHREPDGSERTLLINARPMTRPDGDAPALLVTATDITHHKAAARSIQDLNRQLEGKIEQVSDVNRELEAFSYSVSHDLRAPLRHIAGFSEKLQRHLGDGADEKSVHYLRIIGDSASRMATLIDDLLVYSRLGRGAMRLQSVDMQSLVDETRALLDSNLAVDAPERRVAWTIHPLPVVVADENMMRQVWLNLLGNAVKYSAGRDPARIEIGHRRLPDASHEFFVRDNGAGFDMAYAGKLFGVFQRLHKASEFSGTGIGLASVRRVLGRHGGTISADSRLGEGSVFTFVLPSTQDSPETTQS